MQVSVNHNLMFISVNGVISFNDNADTIWSSQDIVDRLTFLSEGTPEVQAEWTVRLITGRGDDNFQYPVSYFRTWNG